MKRISISPLICLFFISPVFLSGKELSFFDLPKSVPDEKHPLWEWDKTSVTIRGFYYEWNSRASILSAQPAIKSCCLGAESKVHEQIFLHHFKMKPSKYVVCLKGKFRVEPVYGEGGKLLQLYHLEEVEECNL